MKYLSIALLLAFVLLGGISAQTKTSAPVPKTTPVPVPADVAAFFIGEWHGSGKFASGKVIDADVKFSSVLDGQWLLYSHQDRAPNRYKALGTWGFERNSGKFLMIVEDNFGGTRRFESDGWKDGKVVFAHAVESPAASSDERFTFERTDDKTFKMSYETNRDGKEWKLGDFLVFTREP